jgi:excinuclease ABC subunit C
MGMEHLDVFAYARDSEEIYVHYLQISEGAVVQGFTLELQPGLEESDGEMLRMAMLELRLRFDSEAPQAVVPFLPEEEFKGLELIVPQRGEKKALLDLAERNIRFYRKEKLSQMSVKDPERHTQRILETLQRDLRLKELPVHMECFDNSNFQGAFPVSAMVCFKHAKPSKADYRHYNVKTVEGPDDFSTMKEVISRRYRACVEQPETLPQLIVIDGGKGQLNAALQALSELGLQHKVAIIGIAKRLEEIYFPNDSVPMYLDKRSESLKVIQQMRNEAHRFGIAHYRQRHRASLKKSELENIAGIGKKRAQDLLKAFKSVRRIREASEEELKGVVGAEVARGIIDYFAPEALNLSGENHGESGNS